MHGLQTIKKLNSVEQDFIDHILATPVKEVNLLEVWRSFKADQRAAQVQSAILFDLEGRN
jgi:hypothetical protein